MVSFEATETLTLKDAALSSGINLEYSCNNGVCGTCKAKVLSGVYENGDPNEVLTKEEKNQGYLLTCTAKARSDMQLVANFFPELKGIEQKTIPCKIDSLDIIGDDIAVVKLRLPPNANFRYLPGQYINLTYQGVRRSYSIANSQQTSLGVELHIRKVAKGAFSHFVFDEFKENQLLSLEGPMGTFFIRDQLSPIIFLATGTGFAPVKAMVEQIVAEEPDRIIHIYWGMRTAQSFYSDLPKEWASSYTNLKYTPVVSRPDDAWTGRTGYVTNAVLQDFTCLREFTVYACGSPNMITSSRLELTSKSLDLKYFLFDAFLPSS